MVHFAQLELSMSISKQGQPRRAKKGFSSEGLFLPHLLYPRPKQKLQNRLLASGFLGQGLFSVNNCPDFQGLYFFQSVLNLAETGL